MSSQQRTESYYEYLTRFISTYITIEPKERSTAQSILCILHYLINYLALWLMTSMTFTHSQAVQIYWPFNVVRALTAGMFVFLHWPGLMVLNKFALLLQLSLARGYFIWYEIPTLHFELAAALVWSLTKEQRILHFDSKLGVMTTFLKEALLYLTAVVQFVLLDNESERDFLFISSALVLLILDTNTMYYSRKTQQAFTIMDIVILLLAITGLLENFFDITQMQFYSFSLVLFVGAAGHLLFMRAYPSPMAMDVHIEDLEEQGEQELGDLLIEVRRYLIEKNHEGVESFFYKMRDEAEQDSIIDKIEDDRLLNIDQKRDVLGNFFFQVLKKAAEHSVLLQDLLVYLYAPSPKIYCFLNLKKWQHRRQYRRMLHEEKNSCVLREAQTLKEREEVKVVITSLVDTMDRWIQQLMKERVCAPRVEELGVNVMELIEELQETSKLKSNQNYQIFELISEFCLECLPDNYNESMVVRRSEDRGADLARIAFGGEQSTFCKVLSINAATSKLTYFLPSHYQERHLKDVLPEFFANHIINKVSERPKKEEEEAQNFQNMAYIVNNMGYSLLVSFAVTMGSHQTGRSWKLLLEQMHGDKALLFINQKGQLLGCSQLTRYFQITKQDKRLLKADILKHLQSSQSTSIKKQQNPFEECDFGFPFDVMVKILGQIRLPQLQCSIWVVELIREQGQKDLLESKITRHVGTISQSRGPVKVSKVDIKYPNLSLSEGFSMRPSNMQFQFHYTWAGYIQNKPERFDLEATHSHLHESRRLREYGDDITEMRYFENRIDYKSNFQEERDCPSLEHDYEEVKGHIDSQEFYQKWDRKKGQRPLWLKASWIMVLSMVVVGLAACVFMLVTFQLSQRQSKDDMWMLSKLHEKLGSVLNLASLPTVPLWDSARNAQSMIIAQLDSSNRVTQQIFDHNQTIYDGNTHITDLLNTLYLHSNNYIINSSYPYSSSLSFTSTQLFPNYVTFLNLISQQYTKELPSVILAIIIATSVIAFALVIGLWCVEIALARDRQQVVEVLKAITNDDLQIMRDHLHCYKENWLMIGQSREVEESDLPSQDNYNVPKHLNPSSYFSWSKVWHITWLAILISLLVDMRDNTYMLLQTSQDFQQLVHSMSMQTEHLQATYVAISDSNPNRTLVENYINQAYQSQFVKQDKFRHLTSAHDVSQEFIDKYHAIWDGPTFCSYVGEINCQNFLGNADQEGFEMMVSFINLKNDGFVNQISNSNNLFNQTDIANVANISIFYLPTITRATNTIISEEMEYEVDKYEESQKAIFVLGLLLSLSTLFFLIYYWRQRIRSQRMAELLLLVPFEKMTKLAPFHRYYLRHYNQL